ncbi:MAG: 23S rRNA (guanosine2251-2'-O)-methyltransferase [Paraglaciecola sp.]|jgi:23S rRNA (guanosine2251-2'-O)-methyltransferase
MRKLKLHELGRATVEEFKQQEKTKLVLVLDNVRSALNVGSAFRTADSFALQKIYLCGITATPPHREIMKTAIGATESMEWVQVKETVAAVLSLQKEGFTVLAVEQAEGSILLQDTDIQIDGQYALVFGNEVSGVHESVMEVVDGCLEIPQFGTKHSLNISVCLGIIVWEFSRKMKLGTA